MDEGPHRILQHGFRAGPSALDPPALGQLRLMALRKPPFLAHDGLPARKSGEYAKDKLTYVRRYMTIFANSMKDHWKHRVYLDLMAGPGVCKVDETGEEFAARR